MIIDRYKIGDKKQTPGCNQSWMNLQDWLTLELKLSSVTVRIWIGILSSLKPTCSSGKQLFSDWISKQTHSYFQPQCFCAASNHLFNLELLFSKGADNESNLRTAPTNSTGLNMDHSSALRFISETLWLWHDIELSLFVILPGWKLSYDTLWYLPSEIKLKTCTAPTKKHKTASTSTSAENRRMD